RTQVEENAPALDHAASAAVDVDVVVAVPQAHVHVAADPAAEIVDNVSARTPANHKFAQHQRPVLKLHLVVVVAERQDGGTVDRRAVDQDVVEVIAPGVNDVPAHGGVGERQPGGLRVAHVQDHAAAHGGGREQHVVRQEGRRQQPVEADVAFHRGIAD